MPRRSAGVLLHRTGPGGVEVLLIHPGGPFWARRQQGAWQIPKGMVEPDEDDAAAARREAAEELGVAIEAPLTSLGEVRQSGGKIVAAFAVAMDFDPASVASNSVEIEWPPRSGRRMTVPEIDEARWFGIVEAEGWMLASQRPLLARLRDQLAPAMATPRRRRARSGP